MKVSTGSGNNTTTSIIVFVLMACIIMLATPVMSKSNNNIEENGFVEPTQEQRQAIEEHDYTPPKSRRRNLRNRIVDSLVTRGKQEEEELNKQEQEQEQQERQMIGFGESLPLQQPPPINTDCPSGLYTAQGCLPIENTEFGVGCGTYCGYFNHGCQNVYCSNNGNLACLDENGNGGC